MPDIDLSKVTTKALRAELAKRELASPAQPPEKRWKWVCTCGNEVVGGGDFSQVRVEHGKVWCRPCTNGGYVKLYGTADIPASVPMKQVAAE